MPEAIEYRRMKLAGHPNKWNKRPRAATNCSSELARFWSRVLSMARARDLDVPSGLVHEFTIRRNWDDAGTLRGSIRFFPEWADAR